MHRSYVDKTWIDSYLVDHHVLLPADARTRFISILRVKANEEVAVFDGGGREVRGTLHNDRDRAYFSSSVLEIFEAPQSEIVVVQAAIEEKKISETIKRGSEYGVDRFIIFPAERSDSFCFKKLMAKEDRLHSIILDASRQAGRQFVPKLIFEQSLEHVRMKMHALTVSVGIFGDLRGSELLSNILAKSSRLEGSFIVVVGPEGGLSKSECVTLTKEGFFGAIWSPFTLRSELACLGAVTLINGHLGRA